MSANSNQVLKPKADRGGSLVRNDSGAGMGKRGVGGRGKGKDIRKEKGLCERELGWALPEGVTNGGGSQSSAGGTYRNGRKKGINTGIGAACKTPCFLFEEVSLRETAKASLKNATGGTYGTGTKWGVGTRFKDEQKL